MSRSLWIINLIKKSFPGRFIAARATKFPLVGDLFEQMFFKGDYLLYLPKDRTIQINNPIDNPTSIVLPSQIVEHFIEKSVYRWIMNTCICRESSGCRDYPIDYGCLFLGEAVLGINPKLGRMATKEEALIHVRRCREAGLIHLIGRNKLDKVWLGVGPGTKLLTVCNCCSCCCLWKILPYLNRSISEKVLKMPGVSVTVSDRCDGCGNCSQGVCFVNAIRFVDNHAEIGENCRGCGRCVDSCPSEAIELKIIETGFIQNTINRISPLVDLS
jgi:ferredoxin